MSTDEPRISLLGTSALLFDAPGPTELDTQRRIWALAEEAGQWPEIREAVPGMNNVMLSFVRPPSSLTSIETRLRSAWASAAALKLEGRLIELPVVYGGEGGPHVADVVAHTGLSLDDIAEIHSAPIYHVYALGSHPGYCYLGGMDQRIATPRRKTPTLRIPGAPSQSAAVRPACPHRPGRAAGTRSAAPRCVSLTRPATHRRCCVPVTASAFASRR